MLTNTYSVLGHQMNYPSIRKGNLQDGAGAKFCKGKLRVHLAPPSGCLKLQHSHKPI